MSTDSTDPEVPKDEVAAPEASTPEASTEEVPAAEVPAEEIPGVDAAEGDVAAGLDIGSEAISELIDNPADRPDPVTRGKVDRYGVAWGTGRRKTSVARVRIKDGSGQFTVNERPMEEYFPIERDQKMILQPLVATETNGKVDINVLVSGGGSTGQTGAVILGIARALQVKDHELHTSLAAGGFLTRDGRKVERKKYGLKKARKSFQFSKR